MPNTTQPPRDFPPVMPTVVIPPPPKEAVIGRPDIGAELARLLPRGAPPPREAALGIFRRQLARLQTHVQTRFERGDMSGLAAARLLSGLMDELIAALRAVTNERIAEAAQSMTLDTVYFLTGEDSKDE